MDGATKAGKKAAPAPAAGDNKNNAAAAATAAAAVTAEAVALRVSRDARVAALRANYTEMERLKQLVLVMQSKLIDSDRHDNKTMKLASGYLRPSQYDAVVEERAHDKRCGFPQCANVHLNPNKPHTSPAKNNTAAAARAATAGGADTKSPVPRQSNAPISDGGSGAGPRYRISRSERRVYAVGDRSSAIGIDGTLDPHALAAVLDTAVVEADNEPLPAAGAAGKSGAASSSSTAKSNASSSTSGAAHNRTGPSGGAASSLVARGVGAEYCSEACLLASATFRYGLTDEPIYTREFALQAFKSTTPNTAAATAKAATAAASAPTATVPVMIERDPDAAPASDAAFPIAGDAQAALRVDGLAVPLVNSKSAPTKPAVTAASTAADAKRQHARAAAPAAAAAAVPSVPKSKELSFDEKLAIQMAELQASLQPAAPAKKKYPASARRKNKSQPAADATTTTAAATKLTAAAAPPTAAATAAAPRFISPVDGTEVDGDDDDSAAIDAAELASGIQFIGTEDPHIDMSNGRIIGKPISVEALLAGLPDGAFFRSAFIKPVIGTAATATATAASTAASAAAGSYDEPSDELIDMLTQIAIEQRQPKPTAAKPIAAASTNGVRPKARIVAVHDNKQPPAAQPVPIASAAATSTTTDAAPKKPKSALKSSAPKAVSVPAASVTLAPQSSGGGKSAKSAKPKPAPTAKFAAGPIGGSILDDDEDEDDDFDAKKQPAAASGGGGALPPVPKTKKLNLQPVTAGGFSPFAVIADTLTHWTTSLTRNFIAGLPYQPVRLPTDSDAGDQKAAAAAGSDDEEELDTTDAGVAVSGLDRDRQHRHHSLCAMLEPHLSFLCDALSIRVRLQRELTELTSTFVLNQSIPALPFDQYRVLTVVCLKLLARKQQIAIQKQQTRKQQKQQTAAAAATAAATTAASKGGGVEVGDAWYPADGDTRLTLILSKLSGGWTLSQIAILIDLVIATP